MQTVTIQIDQEALNKIKANALACLYDAAEEFKESTQNAGIFPYDSGETERTSRVEKDEAKERVIVKSITKWAKYIYYTPYKFKTTYNPNPQNQWWHKHLQGEGKNIFMKRFGDRMKLIYDKGGGVK
jgi:hypothetical protein